jgi:hypothetical protein
VQSKLDKVSIGISSLCVVHCLFLPVAVILFPSIGLQIIADEAFHQMLVVVVLLTSLSALFMGCRRHKAWKVLGWGIGGLVLLFAAIIFGHDFGEVFEKVLTVLGSAMVIFGHIQNFRLCKKIECGDNHCNNQ